MLSLKTPVVAVLSLAAATGMSASLAADGDRCAIAEEGGEVVVAAIPCNSLLLGESDVVAHDAKTLRVDAKDDTLLAAYLIEPGRTAYELPDLAAEYRIKLEPRPPAEEETASLVQRAALPLRLLLALLPVGGVQPGHGQEGRRR